ncbi:MAG: hypothetical protein ACR2JI_08020, partial [Mycobacterium sp.]
MVRWLQVGAAAAGVGVAIGLASAATTTATAWADDGATSSPSDSRTQAQGRKSDGATVATARRTARPHATGASSAAVQRQPSAPAAAAARTPRVRVGAPAVYGSARSVPVSAAPTVGMPIAAVTASASTASAAPSLGFFPTLARLTLEDVFTGTGPAAVTNPTAAVTGLFNEVLRRNPTTAELNNYLALMTFTGANGVIAGLYGSAEFRQNAVTNYYVQLLGRTPTQAELNQGVADYSRIIGGGSESFVTKLAGETATYTYSASGGGTYGATPSPTSYVNLLYRSLLGESAGATADPLIQSIQAGLSIARAANQFVTSDAYRTVKVEQIYTVLGQQASSTDIAKYVSNWNMNGGQAGISQSLLATTANIQRIEAGLVTVPDAESAQLLQSLMLSGYADFVTGLKQQLQAGGTSAEGKANGCKG